MERINPIEIGFSEKNQNIIKIHTKLQYTLLFYIFMRLIFFSRVSYAHVVKYLILVFFSILTAVFIETLYYYKAHNNSFENAKKSIKLTNPQITGMFVACTINCGYDILPIMICTFFGIIICRLLYGGHTNTIFSAYSFIMIMLYSCFSSDVINTNITGRLNDLIFNYFNVTDTQNAKEIVNLKSILTTDTLPYISLSFISTVGIALLFFGFTIKYLKGDLSILVRTLMFLFILCFSFMGFLNGTSHLTADSNMFSDFFKYSLNFSGSFGHIYKTVLLLLYMIYGATVLGMIFCTCFTNTMPKSNTSKYIVAFLLALVTFYTKIFTNNPFGFFYAVILVNMFTPMLDNVTSNSTSKNNFIVILLVILSLIIGFVSFSFAMRGV